MEAMIFSAGLGTRLQEYTKQKPKALVEVNGKTLLEININRLTAFGFKRIVVNVHHFADQIIEFINRHTFDAEILISDEREELLDTGGGLLKALPLFSEENPVLLYNVDVLTNINLNEMYQFHTLQKVMATLAVSERSTSRYFLFENNILRGWENSKTGQKIPEELDTETLRRLAFSGIQIVDLQLLKSTDLRGKFSMTDLYLNTCRRFDIKAYIHDAAQWLDVGSPETLQKASGLDSSFNV